MPRALVTVGSTKFDQLIHLALSKDFLAALRSKGFTELAVQYGNSQLPLHRDQDDLKITMYTFKPSLSTEFASADLIISHAGSGTIIEVLRLKKPLVIVPNPTLMDNHQSELADALSAMGVCKVTSIENLTKAVSELDTSTLVDFATQEPGKFRGIVDEEMGF